MATKKELKCLICGKITKSYNGMLYHLRNKHAQAHMQKGVNWECEKQPIPRAKKKSKPVIVPNMQYIEVPAIIRIPISMGPIQIVSTDTQGK